MYLAHMSGYSGGDEGKVAKQYHRYLPIKVNGRRAAALVDSGNIWRSAISRQFFESLGLTTGQDLVPMKVKTIGTAKKGAYLKLLGQSKKSLQLCTEDSDTVWSFRPVVIEGLAMEVNLSGPWLKQHRWDQIHSRDCLRIQGRDVPLVKSAATTRSVATVYVDQPTVAKANSLTLLEMRVPEVAEGTMEGGEAYLRGSIKFMNSTDLHPAMNAIVSCDNQGKFTAAVLNTLSHDVSVPAGQTYGTATFTCRPEELDDQPWHISVLRADPASRLSRRDQYEEKFVKEAKEKESLKDKDAPELTADQLRRFTEKDKREWLIRQFKLKASPFLQKPWQLKKAVDALLLYWDIFSHDGSYGKTSLIKHRVITDDVPPIKNKFRPINPALEPDLRKQSDKWLKNDVIEPANSPWSSNLVAARKKGGKIRWCVDWRRLNNITKKDSFPMPSVQDNIARLAGSRIFSGIDMAGAFHCIEMDPRDREKTAFATPFGSFQQKRLGFGLTNGPPTYCRLTERILRDIPHSVAIGFMDDGVVHSVDLDTHVENLKMTLDSYRKAGLKLSPPKCSFFQDSIIYLGHVLNAKGIRPTDSYIKAVSAWDLPKYKTDARAFLGVTGYYRQHIRDYAAIAAPWTDVIGKTDKPAERTPLKVTKEMEVSFQKLKDALTSAPVLGFPYFKGPQAGQFVLDTDFSKEQVAGVLSQVQGGREVVIAYGSKKLSKSQRNYPSTKGELYAGMYWMERYAYYLQYGPTFKWRTDNSALKHVATLKCPSGIIERWLGMLADFNFEVEHRAGAKHTNADGLSRSGCGEPEDPERTG
jgi:hypothetical protein